MLGCRLATADDDARHYTTVAEVRSIFPCGYIFDRDHLEVIQRLPAGVLLPKGGTCAASSYVAVPTGRDRQRGTVTMVRKYTLGDTLLGMLRSLFNGTGMNHGATMRQINAAHDERQRRELNRGFGDGTVGGNKDWEAPFHAAARDGRPVTVSFGRGANRRGELLICDGHVDLTTFYGNKKLRVVKGHDHFLADGAYAANRGKYRG